MPYAYRKQERLRKNKDFVSTMKGKRLSLDGLSLFYAGNNTERCRVGISVSKKLGNAVKRNKIRRRLRASIMRHLETISGYDLVFVARPAITDADFSMISGAVKKILARSQIRSVRKHEGPKT